MVVRLSFPTVDKAYSYTVRARARWIDSRGEQRGPWRQITFTNGSDEACADEPRDPEAMRAIGLAHADRAKERALEYERHDREHALRIIFATIARIEAYAGEDQELREALDDLRAFAETLRMRKLTAREAKATYFAQQTRSRGQKDYRKDTPDEW